MRLPPSRPQSKNQYLNRIIVLGLFAGILITALIWLRVPSKITTPLSWFSLGLIGLGSFLYLRKTAINHPRWIMVLAVLAAVSLVYLFPEMFGPACGGMPRAFALNCPAECRVKECTKWVAGPSTECPNPGSGGGCCLSYETVCDKDCETEPPPNQPPTITGSVTCSQWGKNGWCINSAIIELTATEPQGKSLQISGDVGGTPFSCPNGNGTVSCSVPLPEGAATVNYLATSITTLTASGSKSYKFDSKLPQINGTLNGISGTNGWYISLVDVTASASDPGSGSGMAALEYNLNSAGWKNFTGPLSLSDGVHNLSLRASDLAGNSVKTDQTIQVDTITPSLNLSVLGKTGSNGWFTSNVQVDATASDTGSGVSSLEYDLDAAGWKPYSGTLELIDGSHSISLRVTDNAGNITEGTQIFSVDTLAPTIDSLVTGTEGTNGWYISDVKVNASADDSGSGLSLLEVAVNGGAYNVYSEPITFGDGLHSYQFHATDSAGNLTESTLQQVRVDTILPVIDLPESWELGKAATFKLQDDGSGLGSVRVVVEDEDERFPKVSWEKKLNSHKFKGEIDWNGRFKDGQLAPQGGEYYAWVKVSDAAGNERMQAGQIVVPLTSIVEELFLPSGDQTDELISGIESSETIEEQSTPQTSVSEKTTSSETSATPAPPPISFGGDSNGAAQPSSAQAGMTSFDAGGQSNPPIANSQSNLLWGATATAAIGAFTAEIARRKKEEQEKIKQAIQRAARAAERRTRRRAERKGRLTEYLAEQKAMQSREQRAAEAVAYRALVERVGAEEAARIRQQEEAKQATARALAQEKRERREASNFRQKIRTKKRAQLESRWNQAKLATQIRIQAARDRILGKKEVSIEKELRSPLTKESHRAANVAVNRELRNRAAYARVLGQKEVGIEIELRSNLTKAQVEQDALERAKEKNYDIYRKQEVAASKKIAPKKAEWWENTKTFFGEKIISPLNSYIYQPYVKPAIGKISESAKDGASWVNERVYKPFIKPVLDYEVQRATNSFEWVNEHIFQPHVKPFIENTLEAATNAAAWVNEKIIEPYLTPLMEKAVNKISEGIAWANENLYQPRLKPLVDSFIGNVYQPYISPLVDKGAGQLADKGSWINKNFYQPFIQPIVTDIDQYIYQPYLKPTQNKVTDWWEATWDKYGERVHQTLDLVGFIPAFGDIADGINGLIYLGEGRYLEASLSALAIVPLLGDLGKFGKLGTKLGMEVVEETSETVVKEVVEELGELVAKEVVGEVGERAVKEVGEEVAEEVFEVAVEKTVQEVGDEIVEKGIRETTEEAAGIALRETGEEIFEKTTREVGEEIGEKAFREVGEELVENASQQVTDKSTTEIADAIAARSVNENVGVALNTSARKTSSTIIDETIEEAVEQISEEATQFINTLRIKYGDEMVDKFLPFCEKYGLDPHEILTRPPAEGQSLLGWGLGINNPANPVNHPLVNLNLTKEEINNIFENSIKNPDSKVVVLGYGGGSNKPYYILGDEIDGCFLSLSDEAWAPFEHARANFVTDINIPFIEMGIEKRNIFLFNVDYDVITDPLNAERFSLPEVKLIEMGANNYERIPLENYDAWVPVELLDSYEDYLPADILGD